MEQTRILQLLDECCIASKDRRDEILRKFAQQSGAEQTHNGIKGHWTPSTRIGGAWSVFEHLFAEASKSNPAAFEFLFPLAVALCGDEAGEENFAPVDWTLLNPIRSKFRANRAANQLKQEFGLRFDPEVLLLDVANERFEVSSFMVKVLKKADLPLVGDVAITPEQDILERTKFANPKWRTTRHLASALSELGLTTNMALPEKVLAWFKANR